MHAYIIRRLLLMISTIFLASLIIFLLIRLIPGDIIDLMMMQAERVGTIEIDRAAIEQALGMDAPVFIQYMRWIGDVFRGEPLSLA